MANEFEYRRWNDEQMVAGWSKRERFTDRVVPHVVAALQPGERVLDVGSGGGKLSIAIGEAVGGRGKVTGADISAGMVAMATERATDANAKNVSFLRADVQSESVPGGPFDAMTSQFGVMFFDEPVAAFSNIRRQLKPGGRIAFACWQPMARNTWFPGPAIAPFVPPPPPPAPGKSPTAPSRSVTHGRPGACCQRPDSWTSGGRPRAWLFGLPPIPSRTTSSSQPCRTTGRTRRGRRWRVTSRGSRAAAMSVALT